MDKIRISRQVLSLKTKRDTLQLALRGRQAALEANEALIDRATQDEANVALGQAERALRALYKLDYLAKREDITRRINKIKQDLRSLNYQIQTLEQYLQS